MGNTPLSLGDQARTEHQKQQDIHRKRQELDINLALEQYKAWSQQVDWETIIKKLSLDEYWYPSQSIYFGTWIDKNKELEQCAAEANFTRKANKYISKMCREKYGVKCKYYGEFPSSTTVYLYD